jgi:hypothetical protein
MGPSFKFVAKTAVINQNHISTSEYWAKKISFRIKTNTMAGV